MRERGHDYDLPNIRKETFKRVFLNRCLFKFVKSCNIFLWIATTTDSSQLNPHKLCNIVNFKTLSKRKILKTFRGNSPNISFCLKSLAFSSLTQNSEKMAWLHPIILYVLLYSWFAINLSGCGTQCQPPTPAGSDNGTNKIFLCVVPPIWPP